MTIDCLFQAYLRRQNFFIIFFELAHIYEGKGRKAYGQKRHFFKTCDGLDVMFMHGSGTGSGRHSNGKDVDSGGDDHLQVQG